MPESPAEPASPMDDCPPVERPHVAGIRRAIAAGTYLVDPDRLAAALLAADALNSECTP